MMILRYFIFFIFLVMNLLAFANGETNKKKNIERLQKNFIDFVKNNKDKKTIDFLKKNNKYAYHLINLKIKQKTPLLVYFIENKNFNSAKEIINLGANLNTKGEGGVTPLIESIKQKNIELVKILIKKDADPFIKDKKLMDAYAYATLLKDKSILEALNSIKK